MGARTHTVFDAGGVPEYGQRGSRAKEFMHECLTRDCALYVGQRTILQLRGGAGYRRPN